MFPILIQKSISLQPVSSDGHVDGINTDNERVEVHHEGQGVHFPPFFLSNSGAGCSLFRPFVWRNLCAGIGMTVTSTCRFLSVIAQRA